MYVGRYEHALTLNVWKVSMCIQEKRFDHQKCFYQKQHEPMMMKHQNTHKLTTVWTSIPAISLIKPQKLDNEQKWSHPFFQISDVITMIWNHLHTILFVYFMMVYFMHFHWKLVDSYAIMEILYRLSFPSFYYVLELHWYFMVISSTKMQLLCRKHDICNTIKKPFYT